MTRKIKSTLTRTQKINLINRKRLKDERKSLVKQFRAELAKETPRKSFDLIHAQLEMPAAKVFHSKKDGAIYLQERNKLGHCLGKRRAVSL